jgi:hypothetical protein
VRKAASFRGRIGYLGNLCSELRHGLGQVAVFALHGQELMGAQINFFP